MAVISIIITSCCWVSRSYCVRRIVQHL